MCIFCHRGGITAIGRKSIDSTNCMTVTEIRNNPSLTTLDCSGCTNLKVIDNLPNLEFLITDGCYRLESITNVPNVSYLSCQYCRNLKTIENKELSKINCKSCNLTEFNYPKLKGLLTSIPNRNLDSKTSRTFRTIRIITQERALDLDTDENTKVIIHDSPNLNKIDGNFACLVLKVPQKVYVLRYGLKYFDKKFENQIRIIHRLYKHKKEKSINSYLRKRFPDVVADLIRTYSCFTEILL